MTSAVVPLAWVSWLRVVAILGVVMIHTVGATASGPGSTTTVDRPDDRSTEPDVKPVKPRGHVRDDLGLLVLRLGLAAVMLAHGYQKLFLQTVTQADQGVDFDFLRKG